MPEALAKTDTAVQKNSASPEDKQADPGKSSKANLTVDQIKERLEGKSRSMRLHVTGLKQEFTTLNDLNVAGRPVLDYVRDQPLLAVGVAAGVGVLAGLVSGYLARPEPEETSEHDLWMSAYLDDVVEESGFRVQGGEDAETALKKVLRKRAPVVVLESDEPAKEARSTVGLVLNTALGFGVKLALDQLAQRLTDEETITQAVKHAHDHPHHEEPPRI